HLRRDAALPGVVKLRDAFVAATRGNPRLPEFGKTRFEVVVIRAARLVNAERLVHLDAAGMGHGRREFDLAERDANIFVDFARNVDFAGFRKILRCDHLSPSASITWIRFFGCVLSPGCPEHPCESVCQLNDLPHPQLECTLGFLIWKPEPCKLSM